MKRYTRLLFAFLFLMTTLLIACNSGSGTPDADLTRLEIRNSRGETVRIDAEIADTDGERQQGLSNRSELDDDAGMLFVFTQRGPGFWMKDTLIPLSVAFIAQCGEIVHMTDMQPQTLEVHQSPREYAFGLEVNQGWFDEHDVAVGDTVTIPSEYRASTCG